MELTGDFQDKHEVGNHVTDDVSYTVYLIWSYHYVVVDESIEQQMGNTPENPFHPGLVDEMSIRVIVASVEGRVIDYREQRKDNVRQQEKVGKRRPDTDRGFTMF